MNVIRQAIKTQIPKIKGMGYHSSFCHSENFFHSGMKNLEWIPPKPIIQGTGTAVPEQWNYQKDILKFVTDNKTFHSATAGKNKTRDEFLKAVYDGSMIQKRHHAAPIMSDLAIKEQQITEVLDKKDIGETMRLHQEVGVPLAVKAINKAMTDADVKKEDIKKLIFVSSTGMTAPGVESILIEELGLARDTERSTVMFMGCAAAITALTSAKEFCIANPEQKCLIVSLEMFSFHVGNGTGGNDFAVYTSLFADGCAAVVVSGEYGEKAEGKWAIDGNYSYLIPECSNLINMNLMEKGLTGTLNNTVPSVIEKQMPGFMERCYAKFGVDEVDHWCIHPGGPKIIKAVQGSLDIPDEKVKHSWEVLKQYGNMSSATILHVLDRMRKIEDSKTADNMMMLAFGPGIWAESVFLTKQ